MPPHECQHVEKINEMHTDIKVVLKLMNGNGKIGFAAMVQIMWIWGTKLIGIMAGALIILVVKEVWGLFL